MNARPVIAKALIVAAVLPLSAVADPPGQGTGSASDVPVIVMRGAQTQMPAGRQENGVIVMRPAPGSFLRETTRLAAEAEARDERAAREEAREANLRLMGTLQAVTNAANAIERQQRKKRYFIFAPTVHRRTIGHGTEKSPPASTVGPRGRRVAIPARGA